MKSYVFALSAILATGNTFSHAQSPIDAPPHVRASAAYSEVLLRRTEVRADLADAEASYTETHPKLFELRAEMQAIDRAAERLINVPAADVGKLTFGLGRLLVRKAALESDLARLRRNYNKEHPEVLRSVRRIQVFENAIAEVLAK
jgi:uncharacterized protein involved in exopolysaccharide biosynthesis